MSYNSPPLSPDYNIPGWFDFQEIYDKVVDSSKDGDVLIELGGFLGRSTSYMLKRLNLKKRKVRFVCVDLWDIDLVAEEAQGPLVGMQGEEFFEAFWKSVVPLVGEVNFSALRMDTANAAKFFDEVFFVMADADHSYEGVKREAEAWWPKIRKGGYMAWHDAEREGAARGVDEGVSGFLRLKPSLGSRFYQKI